MDNKPIRILHVVGRMDRGGIETMLMNLYRHIDRDKVQFDFLAHYGREAAYNEEIRALGGRIYEMPALRDEHRVYYWRVFSYIRALERFFREHREYRIVHGHMTNTACFYMAAAKRHGVECRIAHSHTTRRKSGLCGIVTDILQRFICFFATDYFACSDAALRWICPECIAHSGKVHIFRNAIDAKRFCFDPERRADLRRKMDLEGKLAIACVGRFRPEKNQIFLIEVLERLRSKGQDAVILFAGDGPCMEAVMRRADEAGLHGNVRFLGDCSDIPGVLLAADVLALPSLWEGMPMTLVEGWASGLRCVISDRLDKAVDSLGMVKRVSLDDPDGWAEALIRAVKAGRKDTTKDVQAAGYDINTTAPWLENFYIEKYNGTDRKP
ncbi:MAG: glycosyltransferase family 1 protein [Clostridiales bacterium]|nr:glycosyltransferase family 1 protein [Clostridiales bacterium]